MRDTSLITNFDTIYATGDYEVETKLNINGVDYGEDKLISLQTTPSLFSDVPSVGNCMSAEIYVEMLMPSAFIPTMAEMRPYVRLKGTTTPTNLVDQKKLITTGEVSGALLTITENAYVTNTTLNLITEETITYSDWIPQGVFYIDTRERTDFEVTTSVLSIHGYDAMLMAEALYPEDDPAGYPKTDVDVVDLIAETMGLEVDDRTYDIMTEAYEINLPATYTMREVLGNIASMYAGNFCISFEGRLRLVGLTDIGIETSFLIDQQGEAIVFGEDRIIV